MPSSLNLYFDRVFWINLDRREDRREQADAEFERCRIGIHHRFSGTDNPKDGHAGCTDSHRRLWRQIASDVHGDKVLVFEDDFRALTRAELSAAGYQESNLVLDVFDTLPWRPLFDALPHLALNERFDAMIGQVPEDWDVLYLGGQYRTDLNELVAQNVIRTRGGMLGTVAYAMRAPFARMITKVVDELCPPPINPGPVDLLLSSFADRHNFYVLTPRLFIPAPGNTSDISGEEEHFPFAYVDGVHEVACLEGACARPQDVGHRHG